MMKICYVVTLSLTIKAFFVKQLQYLADNGIDVTVVCSNDDALSNILGDKIKYVPLEIPRGISFFGSLAAIIQLTKFFKNENFDFIQYSTPNASFYASLAARLAHCKIRNYHLMGFRYLGASNLSAKILKLLEVVTCRNSTNIECVSKSNLTLGLNEKIFQENKACVVWNGSTGGVDLQRFNIKSREKYRREIRKKYNISEDDIVFGFVGRITRDKGVNEILEAFSQVKNSRLFMIGSIENPESLSKRLYSQSLSNSKITYTGNVSDVEKYLSAIDVLLLPSYREGFGNVIIEAAAMGIPAIVSNIPGPIDTILNNETALTIEPNSVESLKNAMNKILEIDYVNMGRKAHNYVKQNFDSEILCRKILERKLSLYNNSIGKRK